MLRRLCSALANRQLACQRVRTNFSRGSLAQKFLHNTRRQSPLGTAQRLSQQHGKRCLQRKSSGSFGRAVLHGNIGTRRSPIAFHCLQRTCLVRMATGGCDLTSLGRANLACRLAAELEKIAPARPKKRNAAPANKYALYVKENYHRWRRL